MRKHYYIVDGYQPWSKMDMAKLDKLVPEWYIGNVVERLMQNGYILDKERMGFYAPDGKKVCSICEVL